MAVPVAVAVPVAGAGPAPASVPFGDDLITPAVPGAPSAAAAAPSAADAVDVPAAPVAAAAVAPAVVTAFAAARGCLLACACEPLACDCASDLLKEMKRRRRVRK